MQAILEKLMQLAQSANGKRFFQTQQRLLQIHTALRGLNPADYSTDAEPVIMTALAGFEAEMNKNGATDQSMQLVATNLAMQLQKTNNLMKQLEGVYQANPLNAEQRQIFDQLFHNEYRRIQDLAQRRRALELRNLMSFNRNLERMLSRVYAITHIPQSAAQPAPQPTTGIRGWANKLLEGMTTAFRTMNSTEDPEQKQQAYLQGMLPFAGFFIHILGSFFKGIFGKGSEAKINEFTEAGAEALTGWLQSAHTQGVEEQARERAESTAQRNAAAHVTTPASTTTTSAPAMTTSSAPAPRPALVPPPRTTASHPHLFSQQGRRVGQGRSTTSSQRSTPAVDLAQIGRRVRSGLASLVSGQPRPTRRRSGRHNQ